MRVYVHDLHLVSDQLTILTGCPQQQERLRSPAVPHPFTGLLCVDSDIDSKGTAPGRHGANDGDSQHW